MKTIVIYQSKTGFTKKYAKWIGQELDCEDISLKEMKPGRCEGYDMVIYGGGIMAGQVNGWGKIKEDAGLQGKKLVVFGVGATSKDAKEVIEKMRCDNLTEEEQKRIPFFYMEGGINYEKMGFLSKGMLKMMHKSLKKKTDRTPEEEGMMNALAASNDRSKWEYIIPLIDAVR